MLVSDIVRRNAEYFGENEAIFTPGGCSTSWAELDARSTQLGRAFLDLGLKKGSRVATFMPNCAAYIEFFFACAKTGIIGSATNVRLTSKDLVKYLTYVGPEAILVHSELEPHAEWVNAVPSIKHQIGVGGHHGFNRDFETLVAGQSSDDLRLAIGEDDAYQLVATSGTTGTPKGAVLTHRNAIAAMVNWMADVPFPIAGTNLQNIPFFFNSGGPASLNPVMMKGGRTVIFSGFDPTLFLEAIPEYRVSHTILVPTMVGMILAHPDCGKQDLSSLQAVIIGGSPLPREVLSQARDVFGDVFFPQYGMSETYACGAILRREDQFTEGTPEQVRRLASVGKPMVLTQMRVVGDDGADVPRDLDTVGEIWLKGDFVSPGYFQLPDETALSREGDWFKTGDLAAVDSEGFVTIVDRAKDIIISGGINIFSRDVEEVLYLHPAVIQAAAIGIPHERWGESVHGVVVLKPGSFVTSEELMAFAANHLADYKKPRSIEIVESLPIGGTGKILKRELRASYWHGRESAV